MRRQKLIALAGIILFAILTAIPSPVASAQWVVLGSPRVVQSNGLPSATAKKLQEFSRSGNDLTCVAIAPGGGWIVFFGKNGYFAQGISDDAFTHVGQLASKGATLKDIAFTPEGGWVVLYDDNGIAASGIPEAALTELNSLARQKARIQSIAFTPEGGWVIVHDLNGHVSHNIPDAAARSLDELATRGVQLKAVSFDRSGGWVILYDKAGLVDAEISPDLHKVLEQAAKTGASIQRVDFAAGPAFIRLSKDDQATRAAVLKRMAAHHTPAVSIALINGGKLEWARAYGVVRSGEEKPATIQTRFQAASVSKPVAALAALRLADAGKIHLDQDLNEQLRSWKVPSNAFDAEHKPTPGEILSHSAGFGVHGFGGYDPNSRLPTLLQILNGQAPANSPAIRIEYVPGTKTQYSGGGYVVLQQLMIDATGKPFPAVMQEEVLTPLGMKHSTYAQPLPRALEGLAAIAHDSNGKPLPERWHVYPEEAPAGLWTTPSDLALFVTALSEAHERKNPILRPETAKELFKLRFGQVGLGIFLSGQGRSLNFNHNGANAGFRSQIVGYPATGQGAVLMGNSDQSDALIAELLPDLQAEYDWPK